MEYLYTFFISLYYSSVFAEEDYYLDEEVDSYIYFSHCEKNPQCSELIIPVTIFSFILYIILYLLGF